jgi:uncharacterized protein involved in tolerance to divalent cations
MGGAHRGEVKVYYVQYNTYKSYIKWHDLMYLREEKSIVKKVQTTKDRQYLQKACKTASFDVP